jgi:hypothetical protein
VANPYGKGAWCHCYVENRLKKLSSPNTVSWNPLAEWLQALDKLRRLGMGAKRPFLSLRPLSGTNPNEHGVDDFSRLHCKQKDATSRGRRQRAGLTGIWGQPWDKTLTMMLSLDEYQIGQIRRFELAPA